MSSYKHLQKGKDFKKIMKNYKHIKDVINPMGSTFDSIDPI